VLPPPLVCSLDNMCSCFPYWVLRKFGCKRIHSIGYVAKLVRNKCVGLARTIHTVYIRYVWQGNHQIYGHIRCKLIGLERSKFDSSDQPYKCTLSSSITNSRREPVAGQTCNPPNPVGFIKRKRKYYAGSENHFPH